MYLELMKCESSTIMYKWTTVKESRLFVHVNQSLIANFLSNPSLWYTFLCFRSWQSVCPSMSCLLPSTPLSTIFCWHDLGSVIVSGCRAGIVSVLIAGSVSQVQLRQVNTNNSSVWSTALVCPWPPTFHLIHHRIYWPHWKSWFLPPHVCRWCRSRAHITPGLLFSSSPPCYLSWMSDWMRTN